ncbi:substrate-binding periplasmic protein [Spartinivicinus poritis]|uniref:Transporter substrate-binding domain-containing protein n=1 Tax=Spartinivicinus poritis TaxID=2994640 RepID=A0ABT5U3A1_9GAMM|nr:transporter substrate-binding domain-containing protein [Spartinivicinus sp. A2-2]MDE1460787.1 transporter substrate-binding domain-containing protein [Spartinivicinus sp. A2-2]
MPSPLKHVLYLSCILFSCFSFAIDRNAITIATGEWKPYVTNTVEGKGYVTEIITETLSKIGIRPIYKFMPWRRCEALLRYSKVKAIFPYGHTKKRDRYYTYSDPVAESKNVFFYLRSKQKQPPHQWQKLSDLSQYTFIIPNGYADEKTLRNAGLNVKLAKDEKEAVREIKKGNYDFLPLAELVTWDLIKSEFPSDVDKFASLKKPLSSRKLHLLINKNDHRGKEMLDDFNQALSEFKQTPRYTEILQKYNIPL